MTAGRRYAALAEDYYALTTLRFPLPPAPHLDAFTVADPYAGPGAFRKAQLHLHTSNSPDVRERVPVAETVAAYRRAGYNFLVFTDHDRVTPVEGLGGPDLVVVPGEEQTLPNPVYPFGRHLLRLGVGAGLRELRAPAHPSWTGNLGAGWWRLEDLTERGDFRLFEILNGKSNSSRDFWLWDCLQARRGAENPLWGIAVDDTDNADPLDAGWVMVKTADLTAEALFEALRSGAFYATNGPVVEFGAADGVISAKCLDGAWVRFLNGRHEVVAAFRGGSGEYRPAGDEGFVRVEVVGRDGHAAWSQPFFLVPSEAGEPAGRG